MHRLLRSLAILAFCAFLVPAAFCAIGVNHPPPSAPSAQAIATRLSAIRQEGNSYVRLRLNIKKQSADVRTVLQLQVKTRRTKSASDFVVQVLWPKDLKGNAVLLREAPGAPPTGTIFQVPDTLRPLDTSKMKTPLFGSDISYEDFIDNPFAWRHQKIVGTEKLHGVSCVILESKPGKGESSSYASVQSWVDPVRMVPLRVERNYEGGRLGCRTETTRVVAGDNGRHFPASLSVQRKGSGTMTEVEIARSLHDVAYADNEFSPEGLKLLSPPHEASE